MAVYLNDADTPDWVKKGEQGPPVSQDEGHPIKFSTFSVGVEGDSVFGGGDMSKTKRRAMLRGALIAWLFMLALAVAMILAVLALMWPIFVHEWLEVWTEETTKIVQIAWAATVVCSVVTVAGMSMWEEV